MEPALRFDRVSRTFHHAGAEARVALRGVTAEVPPGRTVAVVGRSGSGKSTLIHLAAAIDRPSEGRVLVDGKDLSSLSERERTLLRRDAIGLVFQFFHLLPHLTVAENVLLPRWIAGAGGSRSSERAQALLERVGLGDRGRDPVDRLAGGEMQRVAICRALIGEPRLILADEPTGSLDDKNGRIVMDLLLELVRERGATLLLVTHSAELASRADEIWRL
jgi:ABC-type lipoprotein export system ATPase subunit